LAEEPNLNEAILKVEDAHTFIGHHHILQGLSFEAGADAVTGRGDDVVVAANEVEIAFSVAIALVAGQQPVAGELVFRRFGLAPVLDEHHRVRPLHGDVARLAIGQRLALVIDNGDGVTGHRLANGAGLPVRSC